MLFLINFYVIGKNKNDYLGPPYVTLPTEYHRQYFTYNDFILLLAADILCSVTFPTNGKHCTVDKLESAGKGNPDPVGKRAVVGKDGKKRGKRKMLGER